MADYTDIDKLRELEAKATPGPWKLWAMDVLADPVGDSNLDTALLVARTFSPGTERLRTFNAQLIAESRNALPALLAELVGLRTEVDQLRGDNGELRENVVHMESERTGKCLACGQDWTCSGYYADIAHEARVENLITAERDALQAEVERLNEVVVSMDRNYDGLAQEHVDLVAANSALQARIDAVLVWHHQYLPPAVDYDCCSGCNRLTNGYVPWPCPLVAALGVDPQKEEQP